MKREPIRMQIHKLGTPEALDRVCEPCGGKGLVYSDAWREWAKVWDENHDWKYRPHIEGCWKSDLRKDSPCGRCRDEFDFLMAHPEPEEPEEYECPECDGVGCVPTELGLSILYLVRRYR